MAADEALIERGVPDGADGAADAADAGDGEVVALPVEAAGAAAQPAGAAGAASSGGAAPSPSEETARLRAEVAALKSAVAERHADRRRAEWDATLMRASALASVKQLETGDWKANELPAVTKAGWLTKRKSKPTSQLLQYRRFFVLVGNQLFYFKKAEDTAPRGSILLAGCSVRIVSQAERCMEVDSPASEKAYYIFAATETELDEWAGAVSEASIIGARHGAAPAAPPEAERRERARNFLAVVLDEVRAAAPVPEEHARMALEVLADGAGARAFADVLNRERSHADLRRPENYSCLCRLVSAALLTAYETGDYGVARALLNMCNTFAIEGKGGRRVYVMRQVRNHKIWVSMRVWEGIFYEAIIAESRRHVAMDHPEAVADPTSVERLVDRLADEERRNIVFGQLLSFANEMIRFRLSYSSVSHFVMKMSVATALEEAQRRALFDHLNSIFSDEYEGDPDDHDGGAR